MPGRRELLACLVALLLVGGRAGAEERAHAAVQPDPFAGLTLDAERGPIRIKADTLQLDYRDSRVTYLGTVHVTQGDLTLTSDRLSILFDPDALRADAERAPAERARAERERGDGARERIREIVAEGHVRIAQRARVATGGRAVFDQTKRTIVLSEDAVLREGPNQVAGERIVVYLDEQRSVVESGSNSRVTAVLYPSGEAEDEEPAAPAEGAPR
jgi:lipopolysaccharide export system protein LptA